jgi:hypothetical protein
MDEKILKDVEREITNPTTPEEILKHCEVDLQSELTEPPVALYEGAEIFGTYGNISTVIGKAKSKKTFFLLLKVAEYLKSSKLKVLFFDTEQSAYHVQQNGKRISRLTNETRNLQLFALRPLSTKKRVQVIEYGIYNTDNLGIIIIDGIRDLVNDINSPEEATIISDKLLRWSGEQNIHIINILHQNKGDFNARGHVGTELINKSETTLSIKPSDIDPDISTIEPEYTRNPPFEAGAFYINSDGLPERTDTPIPEPKSQTIQPENYGILQHTKVLNAVFSKYDNYSFRKLCEAVKVRWSSEGVKIGLNKAREFVNWYDQNDYIKNVSQNQKAKYIQT